MIPYEVWCDEDGTWHAIAGGVGSHNFNTETAAVDWAEHWGPIYAAAGPEGS